MDRGFFPNYFLCILYIHFLYILISFFAALAFGPLHNITTKTLTLVETKDAPIGVLDKVKSFFSKSFGKKNTTTEKNEEESTKTEEDTNAIPQYTQEEMQIFYKQEESKKVQ